MTPDSTVRVSITLDVRDETLVAVAIWARLAAQRLTDELWTRGVVAELTAIEVDHHRRRPCSTTVADP